MASHEIEEFGRILVQQVRDYAIRSSESSLNPEAQDVESRRWREKLSGSTPESFAREIIPDVVDTTIFHLLRAIDQELLRLSFPASTGKSVDLSAEGYGELSGWYMGGEDGWRAKYSKERFIDDNADLDDFFTRDPNQDKTNDTGK